MTVQEITLTFKQSEDRWHSNVVDHGVKDAKGRAIGGFITISKRTWHFPSEDTKQPIPKPFGVEVQAARDGEGFGAIPRRTWVATYEEAVALGNKKIVEQRKRYVSAVSKGEGRQFAKRA